MIYPGRDIENMEYAAVGFATQIEFYDFSGERYYSIYNYQPERLNHVSLCLSEWEVSHSQGGFDLKRGARSHLIRFSEKALGKQTLVHRSYLWGWLPYKKFSGEVSAGGRALVERNFGQYV